MRKIKLVTKPLVNSKHEKFCWHLIDGNNQTEAYIAAGYSEKGACQSASQLLKNPNIIGRLEYLRYQNNVANELIFDRIIDQHQRIAFSNIEDYLIDEADGITIRKLKEIRKAKLNAVKTIKLRTTRKTDRDGNIQEEFTDAEVTLYDKQKSLAELSELMGLKSDFGKIRSGLQKYGKDVYIDDSGQWQLVDLDND